MSGRAQIDSVIDDDDEFWYVYSRTSYGKDFPRTDSPCSSPLCIEEFDLSDKNFKPCPCGYQVSSPLSYHECNMIAFPFPDCRRCLFVPAQV